MAPADRCGQGVVSDETSTRKLGGRRRNVRRLTRRVIPLPSSAAATQQTNGRDAHSEPPSAGQSPSARPGLPYQQTLPLQAAVASSLAELRLADGSQAAANDGSSLSSADENTVPDLPSVRDDRDPGRSLELAAAELTRQSEPRVDWSSEVTASGPDVEPAGEDPGGRALRSSPPAAATNWGEPGRDRTLAVSRPEVPQSQRADWIEPGRAHDARERSAPAQPELPDEVLGFDFAADGGTEPTAAPEAAEDDDEPRIEIVQGELAPESGAEHEYEAFDAAERDGAQGESHADPAPAAPDVVVDEEPVTNPNIRVDALLRFRQAEAESSADAPTGAEPEPAGQGPRETGEQPVEPRRAREDSDVPTRPRIELSDEMALAAGRVTSVEAQPIAGEEPRRGSKVPPPGGESRVISSLTGRRQSAAPPAEEDAAARPAVVVTRSKIISDRPSRVERLDPEARAQLAAQEQLLAATRPNRRPSGDLDDFETLDIEEGEVESPASVQGSDEDGVTSTSKAPPPPPQQKRGAAQVAPAAPKVAPPPPPRAVPGAAAAAAAPGSAAAAMAPAAIATSVPSPAAAAASSGSQQPAPSTAPITAPMRKPGRGQPRRRQWWETLFSDEYLRTVVRPTAEQVARQVDFIQASLGVTKGTAVLDVGCGLGQQALEFARRGCLVVALDLALPMITRAAEDAQQEGLRINFLHKDIRDIGFEGTFDAVICVGTTFGFFDDEQNREVLVRLANALKPGGRLLLEVINRDHVLGGQPNLQWFEGEGCVVMEETDFNYYSSRLVVKRTMMREDGRQTESEYSIRLYALHELGQMMQQAGFRVKEVSGGQATRGVFFGAQSGRIILLAERRQQGRATQGNGHSDAPATDGSADA